MKKNPKRKNFIPPKRDEVRVRRNFIEQTLLNLKHMVQNSRIFAARLIIIVFLVLLGGIILFSVHSWLIKDSYEKLYIARKELKKAGDGYKYLSIISFDKQTQKNKFTNNNDIAKAKKEADENFQAGKDILLELNSSFRYLFSPASDLALYELGLAYYKKGKYDLAIRFLTNFQNSNEDHFLASNALELAAISYEKLNKYEKSIKIFNKLIKQYASTFSAPKAIYSLGRIYEKDKKYEEAGNNYKKVIKLYKGRSFYYVNMARKRLYLLGLVSSK